MSTQKLQYIFQPQEDITAYELACIIPLLAPHADVDKIIKEMPRNCMRHFRT